MRVSSLQTGMQKLKQKLEAAVWRICHESTRVQLSRETTIDLQSRVKLSGDSSLSLSGFSVIRNSSISLHNTHLDMKDVSLCDANVAINDSEIQVGRNLRIDRSVIEITNTPLWVGDFCTIREFAVKLRNCRRVRVGEHLTLQRHALKDGEIQAVNSSVQAGDNNRLECVIKCRNGNLSVGSHNFINHGSEIRCDQHVELGDYNFVSYDTLIFDTNTHSTDSALRVREITNGYPGATHQTEREMPSTRAVRIGSRVWIGMRAAVLKGAILEDDAIVALYAVVTGNVPCGHLACGNPARTKAIGS
jgi:acetyltransferase-like isoleucine patch superfamily enzyme